jgi:hypothetical protein
MSLLTIVIKLLACNTGPTVAGELTTFMGDQKCAVGEEATTFVAQCICKLY